MKWQLLANFPFGIFLGVVISTLAYMGLSGDYTDVWQRHFAYGISAILTLGAASLSVWGVMTSIDNQRQLELERRRQALKAAKATLPLAASKMSELSLLGIKSSLKSLGPAESFNDRADHLAFPPEVLETLKEAIEFADEVSAERLSNIIRRHQILTARMRDWDDPGLASVDSNRASSAANWAVQYCLVSDTFGFARNSETQIPPALTEKNFGTVVMHIARQRVVPGSELERYLRELHNSDDPEDL